MAAGSLSSVRKPGNAPPRPARLSPPRATPRYGYHRGMNGQPLEAAAEFMRRGGWVMWPLLALSLISVALTIERIIFWSLTHRPGRCRWLRSLADRLRAGDEPAARAMVARDRSVYARVAEELLNRDNAEHAAVEVVESQRPALERFSSTLSTIITAAPLLGILGTVIGIIESFRLLGAGGEDPVTEPSKVAAGIATALLTTAFGLIVSTFTLFPYAFFKASANRCLGRLEALVAAVAQGKARSES